MRTVYAEKIAAKDRELAAIRDKCLAAHREPTEAEMKRANELLAEIDHMVAAMDTTDKIESRPFMGESQHRPLKPEPMGGAGTGPAGHRPALFAGKGDTGGFKSLGEYFACQVTRPQDSRLERLKLKAMEVGTFSQGGALVPEQFASELLTLIVEQSPILSQADVYPMTGPGDVLKIPGVKDVDHSTDRAGLFATWTAEGGTINPDEIKTRQVELAPKKLTLLVKLSREFMQDAVQAEKFVRDTMTAEAAWQVDHALITGTGGGQPLGILNGPDLLTVPEEAGQGAGTFVWENSCMMFEALDPAGEETCLWMFSPSLKRQLFTMNQAIGTAGQGFWPALSQATGRFALMSRPVFFSEHLKVAGQVGDALLINPRALAVAIKQNLQIDTSGHVFFTTDYVAFKLTMRLDAQSKYSSVLTLNDGTTQVSNFVTLAVRT